VKDLLWRAHLGRGSAMVALGGNSAAAMLDLRFARKIAAAGHALGSLKAAAARGFREGSKDKVGPWGGGKKAAPEPVQAGARFVAAAGSGGGVGGGGGDRAGGERTAAAPTTPNRMGFVAEVGGAAEAQVATAGCSSRGAVAGALEAARARVELSARLLSPAAVATVAAGAAAPAPPLPPPPKGRRATPAALVEHAMLHALVGRQADVAGCLTTKCSCVAIDDVR